MFNTNAAKSLLLVAVVVLAMAGGAMAAAPTVNTETTNTTYTTELNDGDTQTYNDTTSSLISWSADSANASIEITHDGDTVYEASPDHEDAVDTDSSGSNDTWYYNASVADDGSDYDGLEVGAGESVTLNVTLTNDTAAEEPDTTNIEYTYEHTEESAWIASENPETEEASSGGIFGSLSTGFGLLSDSNDSEEVGAALSTDSANITENTSEVRLDTMSSNLTDAFTASTEDASSGDLVWKSYTQVSVEDGDSQFLPLYYESANEDAEWLDTDEDAYATLSEDGETMTVHNPDALLADDESTGTLDVTTVGNEKLGLGNSAEMFSNYDASWKQSNIGAFGAWDYSTPDFVTEALEA